MTNHFRPEEFVEALDGALAPELQAHLEACGECRQELEQLRSLVGDVRGVDAPEPSPLFWDHFSARVKQATLAEPVPAAAAWWREWLGLAGLPRLPRLLRPIGAVATGAVALALMFALKPAAPAAPSSASVESVPMPAPMFDAVADDGSWGLVVGLASELKWADVHEVAEPASGTADAMIDEMTAAQREAFVRLLQKEMGDL
jgi:hypothetical protein